MRPQLSHLCPTVVVQSHWIKQKVSPASCLSSNETNHNHFNPIVSFNNHSQKAHFSHSFFTCYHVHHPRVHPINEKSNASFPSHYLDSSPHCTYINSFYPLPCMPYTLFFHSDSTLFCTSIIQHQNTNVTLIKFLYLIYPPTIPLLFFLPLMLYLLAYYMVTTLHSLDQNDNMTCLHQPTYHFRASKRSILRYSLT